jgi:hypothetical protein
MATQQHQIIYGLWRSFGTTAYVYHLISTTTDNATGAVKNIYIRHKLPIVLVPIKMIRESIDIAGGNFQQGGFFDPSNSVFILNTARISIDPDLDDYIYYESKKYYIIEKYPLLQAKGCLVVTKAFANE